MKHLGFASISAVQQYLRYAESRDINIPALIKAAKLPLHIQHAEGGRIQGEQFQTLLKLLFEEADDPLMGLHSSLFVQTQSYTLVGPITLNCENLYEVILRIPLFERLVGDMGRTQLRRGKDLYELSWHCQYPTPHIADQMVDNVLASWVLYARWLTGSNTNPAAIELTRNEPNPEFEAIYQRFYACPVKFECQQNQIIFPDSITSLPITKRAASQLTALEGRARSELSQVTRSDDSFSESVSRSIHAHLQLGVTRKELIAQEFNISERTLQRRLEKEGTSYQNLLSQLRYERAKQLINNSALTANDIAINLGFSDTRCFYRSFKEWSGMSPKAYLTVLN